MRDIDFGLVNMLRKFVVVAKAAVRKMCSFDRYVVLRIKKNKSFCVFE